jgi:hypothetical protein
MSYFCYFYFAPHLPYLFPFFICNAAALMLIQFLFISLMMYIAFSKEIKPSPALTEVIAAIPVGDHTDPTRRPPLSFCQFLGPLTSSGRWGTRHRCCRHKKWRNTMKGKRKSWKIKIKIVGKYKMNK